MYQELLKCIKMSRLSYHFNDIYDIELIDIKTYGDIEILRYRCIEIYRYRDKEIKR